LFSPTESGFGDDGKMILVENRTFETDFKFPHALKPANRFGPDVVRYFTDKVASLELLKVKKKERKLRGRSKKQEQQFKWAAMMMKAYRKM
jgi:hypothetical protein